LRDWIDRGYEPFPISVNVSRADVYNPELVSSLKALIKKYNIPANLLKLEITESLYVQNPKIMEQKVSALHEAGFRVLMDDFGSGYSSLNALKDIAFDILKIDMNFLVNESQEKKSRTILASVIQMASALEIPVVMEGVETKSQVEFLQRLHCDYAQGYYFSKPVPAELYETLLQKKA
jgi:EAL domain-containing protein (putative c-di-GMP-specific phosphodiesterase class I)